METPSHMMFFLLLTLFYSLTPTKAALIQDVCARVTDHDSCLAILQSDSRASSASNLFDLGKIIIQIENEKMNQNIELIKGLRKNRGYPSPAMEALAKCNNRCTLVQLNCVDATQHLEASQFGDAMADFAGMADNLNYCRVAMKGYAIDEFPEENEKAFRTSYIGAVVMSMLEKPSPPTPNPRS